MANNTFSKTIIIGRLGNDPELKQSHKTQYTRFSISDAQTRDGQERVQWHQICAFGKQAQLCHTYLHKGDLCCVEGRIDSHTYTKNTGEKGYSQSIIAERVTFLSSKRRPVQAVSDSKQDAADESIPYSF